jgi:hypothetical protein
MDHASIASFTEKNITFAKPGRKCIDGRYVVDEHSGMIARPGADFGYVMALLGYNDEQKLGLSVKRCVEAVYKAVTTLDSEFYMHTDIASNPDLAYPIGCGHITCALNSDIAHTYGLEVDQVQEALQILKNNSEMPVTTVTLEGDNKASGVLIVKSQEYTLDSHTEDSMFFVYDKKRDDLFIKDLIPYLEIPEIVYENFQRVATLQLGATLQAMAKDLPIFEVTIDETGDSFVTQTGSV